MGLVGVDLIVDAGGRLHVIEVNPRPTASMELHERATGESLAATHIAACGGPAASAAASNPPPTTWAKCVLFASSAVRVTPATIAAVSGWARPWSEEDGWPAVADIPAPPQDIAAGRPLVTLFARGREPAAAVRSLRSRTAMVQALFANGAAPPCGTDQPASRRGTPARRDPPAPALDPRSSVASLPAAPLGGLPASSAALHCPSSAVPFFGVGWSVLLGGFCAVMKITSDL